MALAQGSCNSFKKGHVILKNREFHWKSFTELLFSQLIQNMPSRYVHLLVGQSLNKTSEILLQNYQQKRIQHP